MTEFDAVIVGSGAGGGAVAYGLTRAGFTVAMIEKGPHYRDKDFFHDELLVCRRSYFVPTPMDEPQMVARAGKPPARTIEGWIACCVGGGTVHMSGFFFRLKRDDFFLRSKWGAVAGADPADWPFAWEELIPYYDEVERTIGVSGVGLPLPPIVTHPAAALIDKGVGALHLTAFPTPRAILSRAYGGREACGYCGFCGSYGCEMGAKSSSLVTFLPLAEKTGRLTLFPRAMAVKVTTSDGCARGIVYQDEQGAQHEIRARVVVVAASAIQSARLLLLSGIANQSGLLGRNLLVASFAAGYGRFPFPNPHWAKSGHELPFVDRAIQDYYVAKELSYPKAGTILFLLPHVNPIYQAEKLATLKGDDPPVWGEELMARMREFFHETRTIEFEAFGEFLPHPGARVELDPNVKDAFGLPVARISVDVHPASLAASDFLAQKGRAVLEAAGAAQTELYRGERTYTVLQAGTARMGENPRDSVLDPTGQTHDVKNLYVADGSPFPSSGGAPFTFSIMANALRIAAKIDEFGRRGEL